MSTLNEKISRRSFLNRSLMTGAVAASSATFLPTILGGCGTSAAQATSVKTLEVAVSVSPWIHAFQALAPMYKQETGITVNVHLYPFGSLLTKELNAMTSANGEFDLLHINEGWCATFYAKKLVVPLTQLDSGFTWPSGVLPYANLGRWDSKAGFFSSTGDIYALPINGNIQLFYYRADLFEQAGLSVPQTWDDVVHAAQMLTDKSKGFYGYAIRGAGSGYAVTYDFLPFLHGYGGAIFKNPPHDWTITISNGTALEALNFYLSLRQFGPPNAGSIDQAQQISLMASGKLLQAPIVSSAYSNMDDPKASIVPGKVNMAVMPRPASGTRSTTSGIWVMGIPSNVSKARQQAAFKFMKWLVSKNVEMTYAQNGGIPVRADVYESSLNQQTPFRYMKAVGESSPYIHRGADYAQSPQILQSTEIHLNQAVVGQLSAKQALDGIAQDIANIMSQAGINAPIGG